jgi:hypothetical protein
MRLHVAVRELAEACFTCHFVSVADEVLSDGLAVSLRNVPEQFCVAVVPDTK